MVDCGNLGNCTQATVKALGDAAAKLLTGVACIASREGQVPQLAMLAEHVRSRADAVGKAPLDQRAAVCKVFAAAGISVQVCGPLFSPCDMHVRSAASSAPLKTATMLRGPAGHKR